MKAIDLAYPPICAGCGSRGAWLCTYCDGTVAALSDPKCGRCGMETSRGISCWCRNMPPAWSQARSVYPYTGWAAEAIKRIKYQDEPDRAKDLAHRMHSLIPEMGQFDAIVPVPLHRSRLDERGFNQSELLATALSGYTGVPVRHLLIRVVSTPAQVGLSREDREGNLKGAFAIAENAGEFGRLRLLLVDDVRTTGATLRECVNTLVMAGSAPVSALTFAIDIPGHQLRALEEAGRRTTPSRR